MSYFGNFLITTRSASIHKMLNYIYVQISLLILYAIKLVEITNYNIMELTFFALSKSVQETK